MRLRVIPTLIVTLFLALILFYSCKKKDEYPLAPHIDLMSFTKLADSVGIDQQGVIGLAFTDGDGNLGLKPNDTTPNFRFNIFIKYFEKKKGHFEEVIITSPDSQTGKLDTLWFNGRIPYLTPVGKSKAITGEIFDTLYINNFTSPYDTIQYEIYIQDRALNKSNVVKTPEIIVNKKALKP